MKRAATRTQRLGLAEAPKSSEMSEKRCLQERKHKNDPPANSKVSREKIIYLYFQVHVGEVNN